MSGPLEVEQVTHIFSQETGFITVITPDLVVQTNEYLSMSLVDSLATYFGSVWLGYQKKQFASGQVGSLELHSARGAERSWGICPGRGCTDPGGRPFILGHF